MAWLRLDPGFSRHVKRLSAGPEANWLWVCSMDYSSTYLTDGFIPDDAVRTLTTIPGRRLKKCVEKLVAVRSWERVPGGYLVHDYLEYNPSQATVKADREAARQRARKSRGLPPEPPVTPHVPRTSDADAPHVRRESRVSHDAVSLARSLVSLDHSDERAANSQDGSHDPGSNETGDELRRAPTPTSLKALLNSAADRDTKRAAALKHLRRENA